MLLLILLLTLPCLSLAKNPFYDLPCEQQAEIAKGLTELRDKNYSKDEIIKIIIETYTKDYYDPITSLLDTVFKLKSSTPLLLYSTVKSSCQNYGKEYTRKPLSLKSGTARGYLDDKEMQSCEKLHEKLEINKEKMMPYERKLEVMDSILQKSYNQINSSLGSVSDERIDKHNQSAKEFQRLNKEYQSLSNEINTDTERYNRNCGGKALR